MITGLAFPRTMMLICEVYFKFRKLLRTVSTIILYCFRSFSARDSLVRFAMRRISCGVGILSSEGIAAFGGK